LVIVGVQSMGGQFSLGAHAIAGHAVPPLTWHVNP